MLGVVKKTAVLCMVCGVVCAAPEAVVEVKADKTVVSAGETFTYTITIKGEFSSPKITMPEFNNFEIVSQRKSQSYMIKEGVSHIEITTRFILAAYTPGVYTIERVIVKDKGQTYSSEEVSIEVKGSPLKKKKDRDTLFNDAVTL